MALTKITPALSILTTAGGDNAFDSDTAGADTLIVDPGAFLITTGINAIGAYLAPTGVWTVTVNGSVVSDQNFGIYLEAGNAATSTITIGADGQVSGGTDFIGPHPGIRAASPATIKNAGVITGTSAGIELFNTGTHTIMNTGTITGTAFSIVDGDGLGTDKVTNSGTLDGAVNLSFGNDTLSNSGTVKGNIFLGEGVNTVTNSGTISANVFGGDGIDTVTNSKTIIGSVQLSGGANKVTNSGTIDSIFGGSGNDTFTNSGTINNSVDLEDGVNKLTNTGTIFSVFGGIGDDTITNSKTITNTVFLGDGVNKLTNSGTIFVVEGGKDADTVINTKTISALIGLGDGSDVVTNSGTIDSIIDLGNDADTFTGGSFVDTVIDGNGADIYKLGGGNDVYIALGNTGTDGTDIVDGGLGVDTYNAVSATSAVEINLDIIAHDFSPFDPGIGTVAKNTAMGSNVAGINKDTITGFENASGGAGGDTIYGSGVANSLDGGLGADTLFGYAGNDTLIGGGGIDNLIGGAGRDRLTGGTEGDFFLYAATTDSGITAATRDVINDFGDTVDKIDLFFIDANTTVAGNNAFTYINVDSSVTPAAKFTGVAGELRSYWSATGQIIEGDVNGDAKADFAVEIADPTHAIVLTNADFIL